MSVLVFVGPNCTSEIAALVNKYDQSYLFEPLPNVCQQLRNVVGKRANIINAACGEYEGQEAFHVYNKNGLSSSLGTVTEQAKRVFANADLSLQTTIKVDVINLHAWLVARDIDYIDRLIIDAQGMDLAILKTLEPMLSTGRVRMVTAEADGTGFRHYDGTPDNSVSGHVELMRSCGFARLPGSLNAKHPNLEWEHESASTFSERLERLSCRSYD